MIYQDSGFSYSIEECSYLPSIKLRIGDINSGCEVDEEGQNHQLSKYCGKCCVWHYGKLSI